MPETGIGQTVLASHRHPTPARERREASTASPKDSAKDVGMASFRKRNYVTSGAGLSRTVATYSYTQIEYWNV
jgi:hypothetical protein